jgi:hypothetical protein
VFNRYALSPESFEPGNWPVRWFAARFSGDARFKMRNIIEPVGVSRWRDVINNYSLAMGQSLFMAENDKNTMLVTDNGNSHRLSSHRFLS